MRALHLELQGEPCEWCGMRPGHQLHHKTRRSQGGDDTRENLMWVCGFCHDWLHRHGPGVS